MYLLLPALRLLLLFDFDYDGLKLLLVGFDFGLVAF
jgi:hypothetical protein